MSEPPVNMSSDGTGLYIHIPFCLTKCSYCSFNSYPIEDQDVNSYVAALTKQLLTMAQHPWCRDRKFETLYIGGGTPTALGSIQLTSLIETCLSRYHFVTGPEITVETNPNTVDAGTFKTLQSAGVNRLSIGVQSFSDRLLNTIGRSHSADEAHNAIKLASETGFTNINIDLIYGLPGQSLPDWRQSLERALSTETAHISIYELMVEENTPMAQMVVKNSSILPTEDAMADMEQVTEELLSNVFRRYEISNFARPGCECRHNIHYWRNGSYLGVGAGAVSSLRGVRVCNAAEPRLFCMMVEQDELPIVSMESLCRHARFRESVIMGLRMIDGVNVSELESRFGITPEEYYGKELTELIDTNLLEREDGRLKLTTRALPVANQVLAKLV